MAHPLRNGLIKLTQKLAYRKLLVAVRFNNLKQNEQT